MAKLSDEELLADFENAIVCKRSRSEIRSTVLSRMPDRMGKVDVAGIAQKVSFECNELMGPLSGAELVAIEAAVTVVLRSHMEGKSE